MRFVKTKNKYANFRNVQVYNQLRIMCPAQTVEFGICVELNHHAAKYLLYRIHKIRVMSVVKK